MKKTYVAELDARAEKFCRRSELHALTEFHDHCWHRGNKLSSALWLCLFFFALGCLIYFVVGATAEFLSSPISTSYNLVAAPSGLPAPDLYLCPGEHVMDHHFNNRVVNRTWRQLYVDEIPANELATVGIIDTLHVDEIDFFKDQEEQEPLEENWENLTDTTGCSYDLLGDLENITVSGSPGEGLAVWNFTVNVTCPEQFQLFPDDFSGIYQWGAQLSCQKTVNGRWVWRHTTEPERIMQSLKCMPAWTPDAVEDYYWEVGYTKDTFIVQCWGGEEQCEITAELDADYGICFLLRSNFTQKTPEPDDSVFVQLSLNLPPTPHAFDPKLDESDDNATSTNQTSEAMDLKQLRVTNTFRMSLVPPGGEAAGGGEVIELAVGTDTKVQLGLTQQELLDREMPLPVWSGLAGELLCLNEDDQAAFEYKTLNKSTAGGYTSSRCSLDCQLANAIEMCGCLVKITGAKLLQENIRNEYRSCTRAEKDECVDKLYENNVLVECSEKCLAKCSTEIYSTSITQMSYPNNRFSAIIDELTEPEIMRLLEASPQHAPYLMALARHDVTVVELRYPRFQYVQIQQVYSMTFNNFLANVGGLFGLWLGPSIITLIKLVFISIGCCACRRQSSKVGDVESGQQPYTVENGHEMTNVQPNGVNQLYEQRFAQMEQRLEDMRKTLNSNSKKP